MRSSLVLGKRGVRDVPGAAERAGERQLPRVLPDKEVDLQGNGINCFHLNETVSEIFQ